MYIHTYTWTYVDLFRSFQFVCFRLIAVAWILWLSLPLKQNKHMPVHAITVVITVSCSWSIWAQDEQPWWCWWGGNCYILLHIAKLRIATVSVHGSKCVLLKYHGISHLPTVQQRCHRYMAPPVRWPRVNTWRFPGKSPSHRWSFSNDQYGQCTGNPYIGWGGKTIYMFFWCFLMFL